MVKPDLKISKRDAKALLKSGATIKAVSSRTGLSRELVAKLANKK